MNHEKSNSKKCFTKNLGLKTTCLIPAAGKSSRMSEWKGSLVTREGQALIVQSVETALSGCDRVLLIAGNQVNEIKNLFQNYSGLEIVVNKNYEKGMLSSIRTALPLLSEDFFIMPMDMPFIRKSHFEALLMHHNEDNRKVIRPQYKGIPGHPVFLPFVWKEKILKFEGRKLFSHFSVDDQIFIPWDDDSVIRDLDTDSDYEAYIKF